VDNSNGAEVQIGPLHGNTTSIICCPTRGPASTWRANFVAVQPARH
jgi:hypothetical protein